MGESLFYVAGMIIGAGILIFVAAFIASKFLKNIYLSVFVGYGCLLLVRSLLGGFEIHVADIVAVAVVLLIFWLRGEKRETSKN